MKAVTRRRLRIEVTKLDEKMGAQRYLVRTNIKPSVHLALDAVLDALFPDSLISEQEWLRIVHSAEMTLPERTNHKHYRWFITVSMVGV